MDRVKVIVGVAVIDGGSVYLRTYKTGHDNQTGWFLPDSLAEPFSDIEGLALRFTKESFLPGKVDLRVATVDSFRGNDGSWHLAIFFRADVADCRASPPDGQFVELSKLPDRSAFAHHGWAFDMLQRCIAAGGDIKGS